MWLRRLLALALAVGLVVGAMLVRARLFDDGTAAAGSPSSPAAPAGDVRIACATELAAVCASLDGVGTPLVEDASTTVQRFTEPELPFDVWLTLEPWPTLAADARAREGRPAVAAETSDVLARSPAVIAARADRAEAMATVCDQTVSWDCLAEHADAPWADLGGPAQWGSVEVGLDRPGQRAAGLLTLAQATSDHLGDAQFNSRSLEASDAFAWLSDLGDAVETPASQSPFERMLVTGAAEYEFVGVLEAQAVGLLRRAPAQADQITILRPEPTVTADVVAVGYGDAGQAVLADVAEQVTEPLADNAWRVPGAQQASDLDGAALPEDNGLPSAAALEALRRTWEEVGR